MNINESFEFLNFWINKVTGAWFTISQLEEIVDRGQISLFSDLLTKYATSQRIKDALFDLAMGAESEKLRFEALVYCRDDAKGRKDRNNELPHTNILQLNTILQQGRSIAEKLKTVDIE